MIQSQVSREVRLELANKILLIKAKKDLSFAQLVEGTGLSEAFVTAALLGQHPLPAEVAKMVGAKLELNDDDILLLQTIPVRGSIEDGIISAINFKLDVKKVSDPEGGHRAVITFDGKYLPTKPF